MNKIKFEFFKNSADISSAEYDSTDKILFLFPTEEEGYLSIGPRLMKVIGGEVEIDLKSFSDGHHVCYLCIDGKRFELPSLEKLGRLFRMSGPSEGSAMARVAYLKEQEARLEVLEVRLDEMEKKIVGRKGIL
jgi:hypothetical protein